MAAQILVVEDEPHIQELISINLTRAGHVVRCSPDAEQAREMMQRSLPDLLLLDWMLPGMSGVELTRMLRSEARTRDIPIILLSARIEERDKISGLEVGADDYITKPFSPRELIARVSVILRRRVPQVTVEVVRIGGLVLDPAAKTVIAKGLPLALGSTEFRLLHFLITHTDRVYSRSQLLDHVWGADFVGDDRTVDVHISRLRNALLPAGLDQVIRTVRGSGYSLTVA
ncbi:phosphate regulon transcriptional regulator PhoB [Hydrogenophaga sp. PBL-H3]|uniref:phosphate regulon transcriptional regulator PhoB n=1 Tax=Hydrogenophaga sp. PBL-H3 TaxID=434010 RepID=UPI00131FD502|nr:phosphate regulon transcriptional regulator PhoB [Hydrogenophaga sp. PBL-H3]QHE75938.1 phosphate regulon transcriptional regulatory protein PhoB [Hydrogenophaga sp. PBL-H3]QHE80362.1 phosphate regulon transcriptional regulatory protein PhoB [Hydrogenophaga sp. PBL-H3]